jgi:D-arginine dehydrogenase
VTSFDFLVIGAGIAGAGIAYHLASKGRVAIIEREAFPGYHTTGRSAALFDESYGNEVIRALTKASRPFFEAPPAGFAEHPLVMPRGCLAIARPDQQDALAALRRIAPAAGLMLDPAAMRRLVPVLRQDYLAAGLFDADVLDVDVHGLHQGFLRGATAEGASLLTGAEVTGLTRSGDSWQIDTGIGVFAASVVVNAAGAWADAIAKMAGAQAIGLVPRRRTALLIDPPEGIGSERWPIVIDIDEQFYFKPDAGSLLVSPADETPSPPCDARPEEIDIALAIDRLQRAADLPVRRVARSWAGLRSFVADRSPVVGFDRTAPGFFWLAGQGGYGIQTAPALSRLAAALAYGDDVPAELSDLALAAAALSPARPGLARDLLAPEDPAAEPMVD